MLEVKNLTIDTRGKRLINDLSIRFLPGQIHGIVGPNGAGKTSFLKAIAGIWPSILGEIMWNGAPLFHDDRRMASKIVAYVPQNPSIAFDYSVEEIVEMGRYPHGKNPHLKEEQDKIASFLQLTHLWSLRHHSIMRISSGERQRAYLARALAAESPVILLDEPTANLDLRHQCEVWSLLEVLAKRENKIIIVATHDLASARRYCNYASVIHMGQCVASGSFGEVMTDSLLNSLFGMRSGISYSEQDMQDLTVFSSNSNRSNSIF